MTRRPNRARLVVLLALLATAFAALALPTISRADTPPSELTIADVTVHRRADIQWLAEEGYDLWYVAPNSLTVTVALSPVQGAVLQQRGYTVVVNEALTATLDGDGPFTFYGGYQNVEEIYTIYNTLAATYPALVQVVDYGDSWEKVTPGGNAGYDLKILRLTNRAITGSTPAPGFPAQGITLTKPVFFLMGGIHAREITTPEIVRRFTLELLQGYGTNADATWLLDHHEIWVAFTTNPDGYKVVENNGGSLLSHRKNTSRQTGFTCAFPSTGGNQYGTDLNRNANFKWGTSGSSSNPCDLTYKGPTAASEPEEQALEALMVGLFSDQRGPGDNDPAPLDTVGTMITLHSYGNLVLYPWGWASLLAPNDAQLARLGQKMASYNGYSAERASELYPASGGTEDYAYGILGVAGYTIEIGPNSGSCAGFTPAYSCQDNFYALNGPALRYAAKAAREPYRVAFGPDVLNLPTSIPSVTVGQPFTLNARISEATTGNQPIAAASLWLDTPGWVAGAVAVPMQPADGSFNSVQEDVTVTLSTTALTVGRHILFVRGKDNQGNWGVVSAQFVDVVSGSGTATPTLTPTITVTATGSPPPATPTPTVTATGTPPAGSRSLFLPLVLK